MNIRIKDPSLYDRVESARRQIIDSGIEEQELDHALMQANLMRGFALGISPKVLETMSFSLDPMTSQYGFIISAEGFTASNFTHLVPLGPEEERYLKTLKERYG